MLYPKEDRLKMSLNHACRNCDHQEESTQDCIFRHIIMTQPLYDFL